MGLPLRPSVMAPEFGPNRFSVLRIPIRRILRVRRSHTGLARFTLSSAGRGNVA
jgi:hypothetical protein